MLNIVTLSNRAWLSSHTFRFIRIARSSNPSAKFHLLYCGNEPIDDKTTFSMFDKVKVYGGECDNREWFNTIRMRATSELGLDEVLYCDADADILQPLDYVPLYCDKPLMYVRSPGVSREWIDIAQKRGWKEWGGNNGFLYLRKDYGDKYEKWMKELKAEGASPRLLGTYAFNALIREIPDEVAELPYFSSVIASDYKNLITARCVQWCNQGNQEKRLRLEQEWRSCL